MNTKTAQQIAIAFKRGLAFIRGIKRMAQDADPDEKWITIGAAEGDDSRIKFAKDVVDWAKSKKAGNKILGKDAIPEELIRYSTRWVTIGRGARIMVDSNGTIRAGLGGKYNGRQFADVFKSREITGEKAALEKPEEQIEEMTEEQHAGEVNGAGVLDRLINGVSVWP